MKTAPKSVTELVVALKKAVNAPLPATKAGEARLEKRVAGAMYRLALRLIDA
jgi:hypothetical protein